jgi:2-iminobutanoate/2-iminopropanoate deaminase
MGSRIGDMVYSSGIMGTDTSTGKVPDDGQAQVKFCFANLALFLEAAGVTADDVIRVTVLLEDNALRPAVNEEWIKMFPDEESRPARHAINVPLQSNFLIQLEAIAVATS